jgi:hypothetical protein
MKAVSLLAVMAVASLTAAKFVVIDKLVHARAAADECEKKGYALAKLKGGRHSNIKAATKALSRAKVGEAWIAKLDGHSHHHTLYLKKPGNFKDTGKRGDVYRAVCDADHVCDQARAVLCDDGKKSHKKHKKSHKKGHKKGYKKGHKGGKYYDESSTSVTYFEPSEDFGESTENQTHPYGENYNQKPVGKFY